MQQIFYLKKNQPIINNSSNNKKNTTQFISLTTSTSSKEILLRPTLWLRKYGSCNSDKICKLFFFVQKMKINRCIAKPVASAFCLALRLDWNKKYRVNAVNRNEFFISLQAVAHLISENYHILALKQKTTIGAGELPRRDPRLNN